MLSLLMFPVIALLWLTGSWYLLRHFQRSTGNRRLIFISSTIFSTIFCVLWQWREWQVFTDAGIYPGDSLHTLGPIKAIALASLTTLLMLCAVFASWKITEAVLRRIPVTMSIAIIGALFNGVLVILIYWVLLSVVPQFYYLIYLQIFPSLPTQWVVKGLISVDTFLGVLCFSERPNLSSHAAGLLGWVLFVNVILQWLTDSGSNNSSPSSQNR